MLGRMNSLTFQACREELEKLALNRYERALKSGEIGAEDVARTGGESLQAALQNPQEATAKPGMFGTSLGAKPAQVFKPGEVGEHDQAFLRDSRNRMWGPGGTDLSPEQLERHRRLHGMQADLSMRSLGGHGVNMPGAGPATVGGRVLVDENAGQLIRDVVGGKQKQVMLGTLPKPIRDRFGYQDLSEAVDRTLRHAVVEHEGGEKALLRGATSTQPRSRIMSMLGIGQGDASEALPGRPFASHFGATPVLEEKQVTWRDPEAQSIFGQLRQTNPDDAKIDALHRQFGGRPDAPIPLGSARHAEIERRVAALSPEVGQAANMRIKMAPQGMSHGITPESAKRLTEPIEFGMGILKDKARQVGGLGGRLLGGAANFVEGKAKSNIQKAVRTVADPGDLAQRIMRLRSAVRR